MTSMAYSFVSTTPCTEEEFRDIINEIMRMNPTTRRTALKNHAEHYQQLSTYIEEFLNEHPVAK
jgi:hypothetical protein